MAFRSTQSESDSSPGRFHLVTGATGFVGAALLVELLRANPRDRAFCLVRGQSPQHARNRIVRALMHAAEAYDLPVDEVDALLPRALAIPGDLCTDGLGIDERDRDRLLRARGLVVWHCAASLKDSEKALNEIVAHNVTGTEQLLELVLTLDVEVFNHVSTAYVAGREIGVVPETSERPRGFSNRYEQSKHYGEMAVIDHCRRAGIAYRILRPSIVISHSVTGRATGYTGFLGWALKLAHLAQMTGPALTNKPLQFVGRADAELNVIPIDSFVEDCIGIDQAGRATYDRVFHLTNAAPPTLRWICDVTAKTIGILPLEIVADENTLDPISSQFYGWTRFERPYCASRKSFSREESNQLYQSPRHGRCPISEELLARMVASAITDYQRTARGAA